MYGKIGTAAGSIGGASTLAYTGFHGAATVVMGATLLALGAALVRMSRRPQHTAYDR